MFRMILILQALLFFLYGTLDAGNIFFYSEKNVMAEVVKSSAAALSALCENTDDEEEQLDIIRTFIEPVRFLKDKSGYFYVYNYACVCVAHAIQKDIVNKNLVDYRDSNGKYVIRVLSETAQNGGGFVDFRWQKPDGMPDKQKLGYVAPIENTDFFIGSGVYLPDNEFTVAFAYAKPPFVFAAPPFSAEDYDIYTANKGIELEIMEASLKIVGYNFTPVYYSYENLENGLKDGSIEIAATVRNNLDNIFYSQEFVSFHNIAVSKKKNNLKIEKVEDLKDKSIITWEGASKDLGFEFAKAMRKNRNYLELANQEEQGAAFFNDEAEVIVIDKTIFEWWLLKFADKNNSSEEYVYHNLFPEATKFYVGFKSKAARDKFDEGLTQIKDEGIYSNIFNKYKKQR